MAEVGVEAGTPAGLDAGLTGQVHHEVVAVEHVDEVDVEEIDHPMGRLRQHRSGSLVAWVGAVVDDRDRRTRVEQPPGDHSAEKARSTGDEDVAVRQGFTEHEW